MHVVGVVVVATAPAHDRERETRQQDERDDHMDGRQQIGRRQTPVAAARREGLGEILVRQEGVDHHDH
ncbi:hypothetical protein ACFQX6_38535 [Streptosporangium lutulentum]